jgi:hypothetical protein
MISHIIYVSPSTNLVTNILLPCTSSVPQQLLLKGDVNLKRTINKSINTALEEMVLQF